jgi:hypothetical protein
MKSAPAVHWPSGGARRQQIHPQMTQIAADQGALRAAADLRCAPAPENSSAPICVICG